MNNDQAISSMAAITMNAAITQFDILLPEPALNLEELAPGSSKNMQKAEDITMIDPFLSSYSLRTPYRNSNSTTNANDLGMEESEIGRNVDRTIDDISGIEVGRDAQSAKAFSPRAENTIEITGLDQSLLKQTPNASRISQKGDILEALEFGDGAIDFGFQLDGEMDYMHSIAPAAEDFLEITHKTPVKFDLEGNEAKVDVSAADFTFQSENAGNGTLNDTFKLDAEELNDKEPAIYHKKKVSQRKRRMPTFSTSIDESIELSLENLRSHVGDTDDITARVRFHF